MTRFAILGLALATACGGGEPVEPERQAPGPAATVHTRILPTNAAAVDLVVDLVGTESIVGLPYTALEFACAPLGDLADPETGAPTFVEFHAERLLAFEPDLIVVSPWQNADTVERMRDAGVRVVTMPAIETTDDVRRGIIELGAAVGEDERAAELAADFDRRVAALTERAPADPGQRLRGLSYTNYGSGGWGAGSDSTAHLVMELAGVANVLAEAGRSGHDAIDLEAILALDPDLFVVSRASETYGVTRAYLEGEEALAGMDAIIGGAIIEVPANLYSTTSHYLVAAAEALAEAVEGLGEGR